MIIKDSDGSVLARSSKTNSKSEFEALTKVIVDAIDAPIIDLTKVNKHRAQAH